jgi:uncharacterized protein (TIGR04255 family)
MSGQPQRYDYPHVKLTHDPLSLVLCQVSFSAIRKMPTFIPEIQDRLRRKGFPNDASGTGQNLVLTQSPEGVKTEALPMRRDEFRSKDERWAVVIAADGLALLTTAYDRYSGFHEHLLLALQEVDAVAELRLGQINRLGIRYIDVIEPAPGETHRDYLQATLHGLQSDVFIGDGPVIQSQTFGRTLLGTLAVRVWQNNTAQVIPPDILLGKPMPMNFSVPAGKLITLIDTDHAIQGAWDYDLPKVLATMDALHEGINRAWFRDIITPHALTTWGADHA